MRYLALDIGQTRVGIAVSDSLGNVASPVQVMPAIDVVNHSKAFSRILEDWEPDALVCGLPKTLAGEEGPQADRIKAQAHDIAKDCNLPLYFTDERLSSKEAKRILREQGLDERAMRGKVDMIAASIFLQAFLDAQRQTDTLNRETAPGLHCSLASEATNE